MNDSCNLVIRKEKKSSSSGWRPVTIGADTYEKLREVSEQTGLSFNQLATRMLEFALERLIIEE